jgi:hypothetical protein
LTQTHDLILWLTFLCGDLNFFAAIAVISYLLVRCGRLARADSGSN